MKKILLIEDNKDMRENTAEILELSNYKVLTAKNGKEGVTLALNENPDLIICDIMMPVMDGYGVLHSLSKSSSTASIPFIFLTAKAERSDLRKGMEMGADDYLTKPFEDIELLNAIESRLKKSDALKKEFSKDQEGLNSFIAEARGYQELKKLSKQQDPKPFRRKQEIYQYGKYPRGIYFLAKGKVKTYKTNEDGKEFITGLYKDGDFFGYLSLLEDKAYADSAMTLEDSEITLIPKEDFLTLIYSKPEVSKRFIKMLSDHLHESEEHLLQLAYNSVRKRVADALVNLNDRYKKQDEKEFRMQVSREDIASLAGTATETTIRTLSDFKTEGLIEIQERSILIADYDRLARMRN